MKNILLSVLLGLWAASASAHSPLERTLPDNNATIAEVPTEISLTFKGGIRLTRVTMTHAQSDGVDLDLTGHSGFMSDYTIPMPAMGNGSYVIDWRGLGDDGHALNGSFGFIVE
jgi:methionine-rich copper-binding protein CopC